MHIAFLTPEFPDSNLSRSGGLGTSIKNLARGLVAQGVTVTVFVVGQQEDSNFKSEDIHIISVATKNHMAFKWYLERKRYQKIIQKHIDKEGIDLIEAPDWTGISAFMKFTVPLIIRLHGSDGYFCHLDSRKQKRKHQFLEKRALKGADAIVSVSKFTADLTKQIFGLNKTIATIPNGINTDDFKPLDIAINQGQLLYFGTLIRKKGVLELAEIFNRVVERVPHCTLLLIGKDANDVFENTSTVSLFMALLSEEAKQRMIHLDEVPYAEIKAHIASSQVVVLPSFAEAFPMTWLETLAMEKALVSSNIGWAKELMVDGVTGFTVDPKDHELYAENIIGLLNDSDKCVEFGKAGREHVINHFSTSIIVKKNMALYNTIIKK
ncbi:glycosyltransferase family 4 protein [Gelidibacter gilvus]|uniref:Glycosyltransferase family 1 protein n=1 Tax=Gelidibacter gilvus TaxID=59602 RepID=A0A4Q0XFF2_9FLAO|nr:glycosyltransferase family 4 protein [Gelidibacter gilvus]RXJ45409.1 glycosyltransferase family 1 protein [Gelidibacter gilvus]